MIIQSKLSQKDYINANFVVLFSRPAMKLFLGCVIFFLVVSIIASFSPVKGTFTSIITPIVMLSVFPLMTYLGAKRNFKANQRAGEKVEYIFEADHLIIKGESFNAQLTWDKVYRVTQTKNWLLIWQNKQVANPIPKRDCWDGELTDLKEILKKHKVKNNL